MTVAVTRQPDVGAFLAVAGGFLAAREAEHNLLLGIAGTIAAHPEIYAGPQLWTLHAPDGAVVGAALRTPPNQLVLSEQGDLAWTEPLVEAHLEAGERLPGVLGPTRAAAAFAARWAARTRDRTTCVMQQRIFRLDRVIPPRPAAGVCRAAEERDRALLEAWYAAFQAEVGPGGGTDAALAVDRWLRGAGRVAYVWDDAGRPVSLAGAGGPTPTGIRIGPVYTPPDARGRGYASNLVAAISQHELDAGRRFCFLFTDLANPTSNHIYQAIGYAPVTDVDQHRFDPAGS